MRLAAVQLLVVLLGAAGRVDAQSDTPPGPPIERFLVLPFENSDHVARIYWLVEASAVLLADELNALGRSAYTREERLEAFEQLQVPSAATLSHATVIRLGQLVGATHVVIGSLQLSGEQISVRAQNIRLDTGRLENEVAESGALDDLFLIFEHVGRRVAGLPAAGPPLLQRSAIPVFQNYIKGLMATATPTKVGYLNAAIKLDPAFDRARLALWAVYQDAGNPQAALVAAAAVPETSPLYARARFNIALSLIQQKRLDDAFATLKTLGDRVSAATVMNNIGVIQVRRPVTPETGRATYYFNQAVKLDQDDPDYYFNLGYAYWAEKDQQAAIFWLREAVRRNPADGEAHAVLGAALQASGATTEAARERERAVQLSANTPSQGARRRGDSGLERIKPTLEGSRPADQQPSSRPPDNASSASWRLSISIADAASSNRATTRRPSPSSAARSIRRRTKPTPTCYWAASTCEQGKRRRRSTRSRFRFGARNRLGRGWRWPARTSRPKTVRVRAASWSARSCSSRIRRTRSS